jgi:hypothetical protein
MARIKIKPKLSRAPTIRPMVSLPLPTASKNSNATTIRIGHNGTEKRLSSQTELKPNLGERRIIQDIQAEPTKNPATFPRKVLALMAHSPKAFRRASLKDSLLIRRFIKSGSPRILSSPASCGFGRIAPHLTQ